MVPVQRRGLITILSALLLLLATTPDARAGMEEEAERQLQLAEEDLAAGAFERAAASAASALRADPSRHEAFVVRALALKGLGRLTDAQALLRTYLDLRGSLPADERVEPALEEIGRLLAGQAEAPVVQVDAAPDAVVGRAAVLFSPASDEAAPERAYAAARPFLGGRPAAVVQPLETVIPRGVDLVIVGPEPEPCLEDTFQGVVEDYLGTARTAAIEMEWGAADRAARAAEQYLACSGESVELDAISELLSIRAHTRWNALEPEKATELWREMYAVSPDRPLDDKLAPEAQALQLDALSRAEEERTAVEVQTVLPRGWAVHVDGVLIKGTTRVPAGRRILRVTGPSGQRAGMIVPVARGDRVLVGSPDALMQAFDAPDPPERVLRWVADKLAPGLRQADAEAAVVVNLDRDPPDVRLFDGERFLRVSSERVAAAPAARVRPAAKGPHPGSVALLAGGLVASAVGIIVAADQHRQGAELASGMDSLQAWHDGYSEYEGHRTGERVGIGLAVGGGVVATAGGISFVLPEPGRARKTGSRGGAR